MIAAWTSAAEYALPPHVHGSKIRYETFVDSEKAEHYAKLTGTLEENGTVDGSSEESQESDEFELHDDRERILV